MIYPVSLAPSFNCPRLLFRGPSESIWDQVSDPVPQLEIYEFNLEDRELIPHETYAAVLLAPQRCAVGPKSRQRADENVIRIHDVILLSTFSA